MAISRVHTWSSGEVLTASDLNAEFNNFINNALALVSPLTGSLDFNSNSALNFRFQNQSATQSAGVEGFAYWQSTEDSLHISTGTLQARVPALTGIQNGELVGIVNPTSVEGATIYGRVKLQATQFALTQPSAAGAAGNLEVLFPAAATPIALYGVRGYLGALTTTTIAYNADVAILTNSTGGAVRHTTVAGTIDSATQGLDGRDQAGAFSSSQDLHAYLISNGTTIKGVLADSAPPTGPDLTTLAAFSGYTYWCYIGTYRWNSSSNFIPARQNGSWVIYETQQNVLTNGTATIETSVTITSFVPAKALAFQLVYDGESGSALLLRVVSGSDALQLDSTGNKSGVVILPNVSQTLFYLRGGAQQTDLEISGYKVSNGDA